MKGKNAGVIKFCTNTIPDEWKIDRLKTGPTCDTVYIQYQIADRNHTFCILRVEPNFTFLVLIAHFINSLCAALKFVAHNAIPSDDNSAVALLLFPPNFCSYNLQEMKVLIEEKAWEYCKANLRSKLQSLPLYINSRHLIQI